MIRKVFLSVVLPMMLLLAACTTAPTTAPVQPEQAAPECSVVVTTGGMINVLAQLGQNYYSDDPVLLIDGAVGSKSHDPQPGEFITLATPAANCTGERNVARQVNFPVQKVKVAEWEIGGFQSEITQDRFKQGLEYQCEKTRWNGLGSHFSGDLDTGGCNFALGVKASYADGTASCKMYNTFAEARDSFKASNTLKWVAYYSEATVVVEGEQAPDYCK